MPGACTGDHYHVVRLHENTATSPVGWVASQALVCQSGTLPQPDTGKCESAPAECTVEAQIQAAVQFLSGLGGKQCLWVGDCHCPVSVGVMKQVSVVRRVQIVTVDLEREKQSSFAVARQWIFERRQWHDDLQLAADCCAPGKFLARVVAPGTGHGLGECPNSHCDR